MRANRILLLFTFMISSIVVLGYKPFAKSKIDDITIRVSISSQNEQGNNDSFSPSISADGRYIAFFSSASNLVDNDYNRENDIFVHDIETGTTELISIDIDGDVGDGDSRDPSISHDGRYIAFLSNANDLVSGDTNDTYDIFVRDRWKNITSIVSLSYDGSLGNDACGDDPSISADGRYVAFASLANNLVENDNNTFQDIFVYDREDNTQTRVSVDSDSNESNGKSSSPSISDDGRFIAFTSSATNLSEIDDTNGFDDIFIHELQSNRTSLISVASDGTQGNNKSGISSISADGSYVAFQSEATNFVSDDNNLSSDIFIHERSTGITSLVSFAINNAPGNYYSWSPSISANGRYVAFQSASDNLLNEEDSNEVDDIFIRDRHENITFRVSVSSDGKEGNDRSVAPQITPDGKSIAFHSAANNLVDNDTNTVKDIFLHIISSEPSTNKVYIPITIYESYFEGPWEQEDNNSISQANSPILSNQVYKGKHNDQDDYFGFSIMNPGKITIDMNSNHTKTDQNGNSVVQTLLYYQDKGNLVKNQAGSSAHIEHNATEEGWYFVRIYTVPDYVDNLKEYSLIVTYP